MVAYLLIFLTKFLLPVRNVNHIGSLIIDESALTLLENGGLVQTCFAPFKEGHLSSIVIGWIDSNQTNHSAAFLYLQKTLQWVVCVANSWKVFALLDDLSASAHFWRIWRTVIWNGFPRRFKRLLNLVKVVNNLSSIFGITDFTILWFPRILTIDKRLWKLPGISWESQRIVEIYLKNCCWLARVFVEVNGPEVNKQLTSIYPFISPFTT